MLRKIRILLVKYQHIISYLFFGVLTTIVNYLIYVPLYHFLGISAAISNIIAWVVSVLFSFFTNKAFVFHSRDWSAGVVIPEFWKFVGTRVGSGMLDTSIIFITVDLLGWNGIVMKLINSVLVVVLNYISNKLIVFKK